MFKLRYLKYMNKLTKKIVINNKWIPETGYIGVIVIPRVPSLSDITL